MAVRKFLDDTGATQLNTILAEKFAECVTFTENDNVTHAGTASTTYKYTQSPMVVSNGIIIGGTAQSAGLVTRGICGVTSPNSTTGACSKENLYINYDGDSTFRSNRQLVLQAGTIGTHYGNNLYAYCVPRGDVVKNYCDNHYMSTGEMEAITNTEIDVCFE